MTDNYEFRKSTDPQGVYTESPYVSKQWNYINDINNGVYASNGLTLVQFDCSSIYNSSTLIDPSQMFFVIPITYVSAYVNGNSGGTLLAPGANAWASTGLKCGYWHLVQGGDIQLNGQTLEQFQPNTNHYVNFKMLSQMSQDDLNCFGPSLGMGSKLDNFQSLKFNGSDKISATTATAAYPTGTIANLIGNNTVGGNGVSNNLPFAITGNGNGGDQSALGAQFNNVYNNGYYSRLLRTIDTTAQYTNLYTSSSTTGINSINNLSKEFKPYYQVLNTNYAVWYDYAVIRLGDIFDSVKNMPLMKKWDGILRIYFNTGAVGSVCNSTAGVMLTSASTSTFTSTCPLIQSSLGTLPANTTGIVSGLFIGNATATNIFGGVNLASSGAQNLMNACRLYYPQITLKPEKLIPYINSNRSKKVCYTAFLTNQFNAITAGASFSALVQSGVKNIRGILLIPYISSSVNGLANSSPSPQFAITGITPFAQYQSPFDTAPATTNPISIINLQVSIGGQNVLSNTLNFTFENFLEQVSLYEKLNNSDMGLSCGLISQQFWEQAYRVYYVDCTRATNADQMSPRNVNISFNNNSLQTIDILCITEYFVEATVDVEMGQVTKL
jgi:hypothetical protein